MQFTVSAATLLAIVSAAQAQVAGFDAITLPAKDEVVPACASYSIKWEYTETYAGTVSIQLLQGASSTTLQLGAVIASGVDNSLGTFAWAVDCALGSDTTYGIKITWDQDATGTTFQYSNPFAIAKSSGSSGSAETTAAPAATAPVVGYGAEMPNPGATVWQTEYHTVTSCAAEVTDCPSRSTVVSMSSYPVQPTGIVYQSDYAPHPAPAPTTTAPVHHAGNATATGYLYHSGFKTTGAPAATTAPVVTAGAGRAAAGGLALVAGLVAAVLAL